MIPISPYNYNVAYELYDFSNSITLRLTGEVYGEIGRNSDIKFHLQSRLVN